MKKSDCCNAEIKVVHRYAGTATVPSVNVYECQKCKAGCQAISQNRTTYPPKYAGRRIELIYRLTNNDQIHTEIREALLFLLKQKVPKSYIVGDGFNPGDVIVIGTGMMSGKCTVVDNINKNE